jgi:hypothetical protein
MWDESSTCRATPRCGSGTSRLSGVTTRHGERRKGALRLARVLIPSRLIFSVTDPSAGARFLLEEGKLNLTLRLLVEFKNMQRNEMFAQVGDKVAAV